MAAESKHYGAGNLYPILFNERGLILSVVFWLLRTERVRRGFLTGLFFCGNVREIGGIQAMDAVSAEEWRFLDFYSNNRLKAVKQ